MLMSTISEPIQWSFASLTYLMSYFFFINWRNYFIFSGLNPHSCSYKSIEQKSPSFPLSSILWHKLWSDLDGFLFFQTSFNLLFSPNSKYPWRRWQTQHKFNCWKRNGGKIGSHTVAIIRNAMTGNLLNRSGGTE
jgi:hypothetical protein